MKHVLRIHTIAHLESYLTVVPVWLMAGKSQRLGVLMTRAMMTSQVLSMTIQCLQPVAFLPVAFLPVAFLKVPI
jgi:hypothetical protein